MAMRIASSIVLLMAVSQVGCSVAPKLSLRATQRDTGIEFEFYPRGINGLLGLRVWQADTKELLWDVNLNYYRGARWRYGDVPRDFETFKGARNSASQNCPDKNKKPRPLPADRRLFASVDCQYDSFMAASSRTFLFSIKTGADGSVAEVSPVEYLRPDDFPRRQ